MNPLPLCGCGCGEQVKTLGSEFKVGHNMRLLDIPRNPTDPRKPGLSARLAAAEARLDEIAPDVESRSLRDSTTKRRRNPKMARSSEQASAAANARWTPEARTAKAVSVLVAGMSPLTAEQCDQLRAVLERGDGA